MTAFVLLDPGKRVDPGLMAAAAEAITRQVRSDLAPCWGIDAGVTVATDPAEAAPDFIVALTASLAPDDCGRVRPATGPATLKVVDTPGGDEWTRDASRQILEALVEQALPAEIRSCAPQSPQDRQSDGRQGSVDFPLSICAPCGAAGYEVDGVLVCDFVTPAFFTSHGGDPCSFTGAVATPRTVAPGGWLAWRDAEAGLIRQLIHVEADSPPRVRDLGVCAEACVRDFVDRRTLLLARANRPLPDEGARRARAAARVEAARRRR